MTEIFPRPPSRKCTIKCLSQRHNKMVRVGFKARSRSITIMALRTLNHAADDVVENLLTFFI